MAISAVSVGCLRAGRHAHASLQAANRNRRNCRISGIVQVTIITMIIKVMVMIMATLITIMIIIMIIIIRIFRNYQASESLGKLTSYGHLELIRGQPTALNY